MAQRRNKVLLRALKTRNCSLDKIRPILERHPVTQVTDEEFETKWLDTFMENPFEEAIRLQLNTDILQEIINHGLNVNQTFRLLVSPLYMILARKHNIPLTTEIKLLFENGADANAMCPMITPRRTCVNYFVCDDNNWDYEYFLPMIKLLYHHVDTETNTDALHKLFINALKYIVLRHDYSDEEKCKIKNAIVAVQFFVKSGTPPELNMFKRFFKRSSVAKGVKPLSKLGLLFLKELCELPIECIILTEFKDGDGMELYLETINFNPSESSNKNFEKLFIFIKLMWNSRFEECKKMEKDLIGINCSLWQSIQYLCTTDLHITNDILYEILYKLSKDEYRQFRNGVCHTAKNIDLMDFFEYVWFLKQYSGNVYLFDPDIFDKLSRFLSKEDVFNYILVILPDTI